jgi:hypothetical protein
LAVAAGDAGAVVGDRAGDSVRLDRGDLGVASTRGRLPHILIALMASSWGVAFGATGPAEMTLDRYLQGSPATCSEGEQRMEVEIEASLPRLEKHGGMKGLKVISQSGQVAYRFLRFTGDKLVKSDVIVRFLTVEARPPASVKDAGITAQNYKFHFSRIADYRGATAYVYQLKPRKKRVGLYKGELWLDAASGSRVREAGEFVKSPSVFIRRVQFVREYAAEDSQLAYCGQPELMSINVETRIVGDADMVVRQHPAGDVVEEPVEDGDGQGVGVQN